MTQTRLPELRSAVDLLDPAGKTPETRLPVYQHSGVDEELDAVIPPHPPLPFPNLRDQNHLEVGPMRIDAIIHAVVCFDPVSVHIAWIGLFRVEAPPRSEPEPAFYFFQCCRWSPGGNAPVAGSKAGITPPP
jgi:hypothetical protein